MFHLRTWGVRLVITGRQGQALRGPGAVGEARDRIPLAGKRLVLHHGERFTGLLLPVLRRAIAGPKRQGFIAMNEALKREAEHGAD